jgi:metal-responsive CopG/Arc/MetJ family transcriptional regulator
MAKIIYVKLDEELIEKIDQLRKTPKGEIPRAEFLENLIRKAISELEVLHNG